MLGMLEYLQIHTRPDSTFAVIQLLDTLVASQRFICKQCSVLGNISLNQTLRY